MFSWLRHWLTFSMLADELDMPRYKRRWLQRRILGTSMHADLGIVRAETLQGGERLPIPPKSAKSAWLIRRDLFERRRAEVLAFLFPPDEGALG